MYQYASVLILLIHTLIRCHVLSLCSLKYFLLCLPRVMRRAPTEELSAGVIDGVNMDEVVLVEQGGELSGSVTFTEDVTLLAGLTADTNVLDSCDFGKVLGGGQCLCNLCFTAVQI